MLSLPRARVIVLLAACLALFVVLGLLVANGLTLGFDQPLIELLRTGPLVEPLRPLEPLTELGSTPVVTAVALLALVVELLLRRPWLGLEAAATIGIASLVNGGVKRIVERTRPDLLLPIVVEPGYSFPSGHSALSMVAYGIVAVLFTAHTELPRWLRAAGVIAAAAVILTVGASRVYVGAHYPSDVLGGWLLGGTIVILFVEVTRELRGERRPARRLAQARVSPAARSRDAEAAAADRGAPRSDPPAGE
ncbi:MAG TPA: phosphatase PAP2 family protein [Candidatus Limnocylindria bacterium]|nr:phosphatase PAP2 family protein [Candidatus Limnocylindria bacterium]